VDVAAILNAPRSAIRANWFKTLASAGLPGVQFTEPAGDPGLYGPDSAIWYVHGDVTGLVGGLSGLLLGALHEPTMYGTVAHSSYRDDPLARLGRTASFVNAMTWGSMPVVDRACDLVRTLHRRVNGVMPDGRRYDANDSDQLIWTAVTQAHSIMRAHLRYHPKPVSGSRIDEYYAQYSQFAIRLGATKPVPVTRDEVEDYFADMRPQLSFAEETADLAEFFRRPVGSDPVARAASQTISRAAFDTMPAWAKRLYGTQPVGGRWTLVNAVDDQVTRQSALALLATLRWALGEPVIQAQARTRSLSAIGQLGLLGDDRDLRDVEEVLQPEAALVVLDR
jgi:uncharacterized protein (DUF2236 family)